MQETKLIKIPGFSHTCSDSPSKEVIFVLKDDKNMNIAQLTFNPFQENTYVVWDEMGECAVIDAGNYTPQEDAALIKFLAEKGLKPVIAFNTHGHVDHMLGVRKVKEEYGAPFAIHGADSFLIETAPMHGSIYGFNIKEVPSIDTDLDGVAEVKFGNTVLQVIHTPGHTPGHVCYYEPESRTLFSGDTLFKESIGRTDLPGGDYGWIMRSIIDRLLPLGEDVKFYPGHGPSSTIGHEMLYNPFITEVLNGEVKPE